MGIRMKTTEVTLGTGRPLGFREPLELFGAMEATGDFFSDTVHTIAINTRETEFGSIIEPVPITLKTYKQFQTHGHPHVNGLNGYSFPPHHMNGSSAAHRTSFGPLSSVSSSSPVTDLKDTSKITRAPPKKKWIREYLEEEPKSPVSLRVVSVGRSNGIVRPASPRPAVAPPAAPAPAPTPAPAPAPAPAAALPSAPILDFAQEHSRPRTTSITHGPPQIPSPPSVGSSGSGSNGSAPRAGTREVHNKLEKNRRAHLKECFELLRRQLPPNSDDKKASNLSILGSSIRYIQVLRRKERECEHEMERLAREKIAAQQQLAALKREVVPVRLTARPRTLVTSTSSALCGPDTISDEKDIEERVNGHVLGMSITSSPPHSPPQSLNLSTKLRTLPIQITPTTSQPVRSSYGARHNTLTLTTLAPAEAVPQQNGVLENGVTNALSTLVHPAQIHLPISQVVGGGVVVTPAALQLLSSGGGLRVLHHNGNHPDLPSASYIQRGGVTATENNRIQRTENGIVASTAAATTEGVAVNGLTPLVVSQPAHLLHTHTLTHKMVESQLVKGSVAPLTVSAQYLSTTIVKPVVVVSSPHT